MPKTLKELKEYLKKLPKDFIVLVNVKAENYLKTNMEILKLLCNDEGLPGVYITVNKPYQTMVRMLDDHKVKTDKLFFIDCITKTAGGQTDPDNKRVLYMDSPQNLTGLGVALGEAVRAIDGNNKFLFLDSLSTLQLYHNVGTVAKFSHFLTGRMRMWALRGILISMEKEADPTLTTQLAQFCDNVVTLEDE
ncbi:MAG: hypothetical protein JXB14_05695 [Candidatus Altiarchaeota archaeon]|nr:hypothetical protein [Candidatus Altiarchaeota archaeon]